MNWHYGQPIVDDEYLCCVRGYAAPIILSWYEDEWGLWSGRNNEEWAPFIIQRSLKDDYCPVICYIGFDEIPMPEGW